MMKVVQLGDLVGWPPIFVIPGRALDGSAALEGDLTAIEPIPGAPTLRVEIRWNGRPYLSSIPCKDTTLPVPRIAELVRGHVLGRRIRTISALDRITVAENEG